MLSPVINQKRILIGLASGFGLVMLLLSIAGFYHDPPVTIHPGRSSGCTQ
jgi:hypothetical protein